VREWHCAPCGLRSHGSRSWAEGLKYGLPKFTGLSTFFRQPFSPTLQGAK